MNRREACRLAHAIVYQVLASRCGDLNEDLDGMFLDPLTDRDSEKVGDEMDAILRRHLAASKAPESR